MPRRISDHERCVARVTVAFNDASGLLWFYLLNLEIIAFVVVPDVTQITGLMQLDAVWTVGISDPQL